MTKNKTLKSSCCNAEITAVCSDEEPDNGSTWHCECSECGKSCDVLINADNKTKLKSFDKETEEAFFGRLGKL